MATTDVRTRTHRKEHFKYLTKVLSWLQRASDLTKLEWEETGWQVLFFMAWTIHKKCMTSALTLYLISLGHTSRTEIFKFNCLWQGLKHLTSWSTFKHADHYTYQAEVLDSINTRCLLSGYNTNAINYAYICMRFREWGNVKHLALAGWQDNQ